MLDTKIEVLDFAHSDYDGNNVTIEIFSNSKLEPYSMAYSFRTYNTEFYVFLNAFPYEPPL